MLVKRSVRLAGHATSVALEPAFWEVLEGVAAQRGLSLDGLIETVDSQRTDTGDPLASRLRVFALLRALGGEVSHCAGS